MSRITGALLLAVAARGFAQTAEPPAPPPSDLDALELAERAPEPVQAAAGDLRVYVEGAVGRTRWHGTESGFSTARAAVDLRLDRTLAPGVRGVLSDRLDLSRSDGTERRRDANTLREAYVSWARADDQSFDIGRLNVRHGFATGYNPTDWFKEDALRAVVSPDPLLLRENRQGTVVLRGQQLLGSDGSLTAALSPKLGDGPSQSAWAWNAGATNPRTRWLLTGSRKFSDTLNSELLLHGGGGMSPQLGFNVSALLGDATVAFGEATVGKGRSLIGRALGLSDTERRQRRAAVGLTYTTDFNLSVTGEAQYNSAAPDSDQWDALRASQPGAELRVLATAQRLQDLAVRRAWLVYATWKDAGLRRLNFSGFLRLETETDSRDAWLEARYRWDSADLALQWLVTSGRSGSINRVTPQRGAIEASLRFYF